MHYVVGSGPSGVACAAALVGRGCEVTLLDAGLDLEPERRALVDRLRASSHDAEAISSIKGRAAPTVRGLPRKLAYGSDYPYRHVASLPPLEATGFEGAISLARGGLSTVWGGAVLPFAASDIADWPISWDDLAPHYRVVSDLIGVTGREDDFSHLPIFGGRKAPLRSSAQAEAVLRDLGASREALLREGMRFGVSRLAVSAEDCQYCGLCLHGCPRNVPYTSATTLEQLIRAPGFRYESGVVVERLTETSGGVQLDTSRLSSGERSSFTGERVYLACGVLSTARLLLRSLGLHGRSIPLLGSQYFMLPWVRYEASPGVAAEGLHTLAQLFIEVEDPAISPRAAHLQVYGYNDLYSGALAGRFGMARSLVAPLLTPLLERLLVIQGYLHSAESRPSQVELTRGTSGERLLVRGTPDAAARGKVRAVARKLHSVRRLTRAVPLIPMLHVGAPGSGHHIGGTFPMRRAPGPFDSDVFGRPLGLRRTHLVDASTFPSIPATTITLSIMANAHRIGSASEVVLA